MELNQKVIVRADRAGVFYGTIIRKDGDEVELKDCRRIWYWNGAASLSELALSGVKRTGNKFSVTVDSITILGVIEIIPCTEEARPLCKITLCCKSIYEKVVRIR